MAQSVPNKHTWKGLGLFHAAGFKTAIQSSGASSTVKLPGIFSGAAGQTTLVVES